MLPLILIGLAVIGISYIRPIRHMDYSFTLFIGGCISVLSGLVWPLGMFAPSAFFVVAGTGISLRSLFAPSSSSGIGAAADALALMVGVAFLILGVIFLIGTLLLLAVL